VLAIGADDVVVVAQRRERTDGDRFLADVQMQNPPILPSAYASAAFSSKRGPSSICRSIFEMQIDCAVSFGRRAVAVIA